jgi:hypothetical protein
MATINSPAIAIELQALQPRSFPIDAPVTTFALVAFPPSVYEVPTGVFTVCTLNPTPPSSGDTTGPFLPLPDGFDPDDLPLLDSGDIVDTSPNQIIGCVDILVEDYEQNILNALFPGAVAGDGVVARETEDIWKYDGTIWENVGPSPGPTILPRPVVPLIQYIERYDASIHTRLQIQSLDYALALLTEPDPIGVVLGLDARRVRRVLPPAVAFDVAALPCKVSSSVKVDVPAISVDIASFAPSVAAGFSAVLPLTSIGIFAPMPKSIGRVRAQINLEASAALTLQALTPSIISAVKVNAPLAALTVTAVAPTKVGEALVLPNIGDAFEGGFYAGLISHTADGVATHALIVAPVATGATGGLYPVTTGLQWKTTGSLTSGTSSSFDGAANTAAMVTAGIANHPAAEFCVNLTIGGYTDWYLPARYELDIAYENLKPTTTNNSTAWGINDYSVPKRTVNRTTTSTAQTSVAAFQSGGAEAFVDGNHWSSTEISTLDSFVLFFSSGLQTNDSKTSARRLRAFRKIAL